MDEKESFDLQVAKFFFSSNLPFSVVENKHFVKLCSDLRPGYKPPSRKKLGNELLNSVHDEVCKDMKRNILEEGKTITLMQDGWSNIHNTLLLPIAFTTERKHTFYQ